MKPGKQITSRFWKPYDALIMEKAKEARIQPTQLVRMATMAFVDCEFLSLHKELLEIKKELAQFRKDFSDVVER